ncbi:MAG: YihY/virulence factor BrkB family protein [Candidatus Hatepunaea meridiana]|nr:YihY/virulence factor BrkB family protein [Candidatus Hatepunaea meridiana]
MIIKTKYWFKRLEEKCQADSAHNRYICIARIIIQLYRFVQITVREFLDDRLFLRAMALTFATLLSLIPLLAISFSMFKLFGGGVWFMEVLRPVLTQNLAPGSEPIVAQRIEELIFTGGGTTIGGISILFFLLAIYGIFSAIESTFNLIWGTSSRAGALHRVPLYWGLVTIIPLLVVSSLALTTYLKALPLVVEAVERVGFAENLINRLLPGIMVMVSFFLLYRFLPSTRVRTYAAAIGAITAGLLYELIKSGFIIYTGKLVQYDVIYGSLAIAPLLMIWVNLSWVIVLMGVEVCFVSQHYNVLLNKRKHIKFSRSQKDALAYLILTQVTLAFRGKREPVTIDEWSHNYGVPPGIVTEVIERLRKGGVLTKTGPGRNEILITRDPDYLQVSNIDSILSGELLEEWNWPSEESWQWLKDWMQHRAEVAGETTDGITLGELVSSLMESEQVSK